MLVLLLGQAARRQAGHAYVFPSPRRPDRPLEDVRGAWARVARADGLPEGTRIHDLRHSFASVLANLGTPLNEIGVLLGHTQISTTQRYAHHATAPSGDRCIRHPCLGAWMPPTRLRQRLPGGGEGVAAAGALSPLVVPSGAAHRLTFFLARAPWCLPPYRCFGSNPAV